MIIYNVTVNIDDSVHDEWLHWMRSVHIPDVLAWTVFRKPDVACDESGGKLAVLTYSIQYSARAWRTSSGMNASSRRSCGADALRRYPNKFVAFGRFSK